MCILLVDMAVCVLSLSNCHNDLIVDLYVYLNMHTHTRKEGNITFVMIMIIIIMIVFLEHLSM